MDNYIIHISQFLNNPFLPKKIRKKSTVYMMGIRVRVRLVLIVMISILLPLLLYDLIYDLIYPPEELPHPSKERLTRRETFKLALELFKKGEYIPPISPSYPPGVIGPALPPFRKFSLEDGIKIVSLITGKEPMIPKWVPEDLKYSAAFLLDSPLPRALVIVCYDDKPISHFHGKEMIQISMQISTHHGKVPDPEYLKRRVEEEQKRGKPVELLKIGEIYVRICKKARYLAPNGTTIRIPIATFWDDTYIYYVGVRPPLTVEDLIKVVESMILGRE